MNRVLIFKKIAKYCGKMGMGKSQKMLNLYEEILSKIGSGIRSDFIIMDDQKVFLDKEDSLMLSIKNNKHELTEIELLKQIIKNGDTVLDLGANIGVYTLIFAKLVGKSGHVFAFEPDPTNFEILKKNILVNKHENVILENKAVSNKEGNLKLYLSTENNGMHRIYPSKWCKESIDINSIKIDNYFNKNQKIDFIKLDIEGAEYDALLGMESIIQNNENIVIFIEFVPTSLEEHGTNPEKVIDFFINHKFKIFKINNIAEKKEEISKEELLNFKNKDKVTNLICKRII